MHIFQCIVLFRWVVMCTTDNPRKLYNHQELVDDGLVEPSLQKNQQSVAVCIGGQVGRAMPIHLRNGLIKANTRFFFYLFYNLQSSERLIYNTNPKLSYQPSKLAGLNSTEIENHLQSLMNTSNLVMPIDKHR